MSNTPLFREGHALIIGVSQYDNPQWNAPVTERDAEGVYDALVDPEVGAYPRGQVERLIGAQATREGVLQALRRLAERAASDNVVVVFFAGHGALGAGEEMYYLATKDTQFSEDGRVAKHSGLSCVQLARALREIKAQQLLVIINSCFSGHLGEKLPAIGIEPEVVGEPVPYGQADELAKAGEGRVIITASRPEQKSVFDTTSQHSYFGQAVIDGLKGSRINQASGYIGVFDLYNAVYHQVRQITEGRGEVQEPVLTVLRNIGPFPVARYPRATTANKNALAPLTEGVAVRLVQQANVSGRGNTVIQTGSNSPVTNKRSLIDMGTNNQFGDFKIGSVTEGDSYTVNINNQPQQEAAEEKNPLEKLPGLEKQMATARNVNEDDRDEAALRIKQGYRAYVDGNQEKARERLTEALRLMRAMGNGYVNSLVRKVEAAIEAL